MNAQIIEFKANTMPAPQSLEQLLALALDIRAEFAKIRGHMQPVMAAAKAAAEVGEAA